MSVCAKFQLSSWSRSAWKVCVWRFHGLYAFQVTTMSNLNPSCFELLWVELRRVELRLGFNNIFGNLWIPENKSKHSCKWPSSVSAPSRLVFEYYFCRLWVKWKTLCMGSRTIGGAIWRWWLVSHIQVYREILQIEPIFMNNSFQRRNWEFQ